MELSPADRAAVDQAIAATEETIDAYIDLAKGFDLVERSRLSRLALYVRLLKPARSTSSGARPVGPGRPPQRVLGASRFDPDLDSLLVTGAIGIGLPIKALSRPAH
ncbi:hypothetical protein L0U85_19900 [Glycomyces sp. L485]|uniref:hypothetical protein n=1 Tax=Glycomyces sp. L485 TaxID=2909235 RepID=UPI001F4ADB16|nr:hypothetical protein [Glycomyces sp. L485]MCH7233101.1 hypothetical protein [Glycomyces sp. L485]